jgi:integrase-like protein
VTAAQRTRVAVRRDRRLDPEGSIYPYRNGYAAYTWTTTASGKRVRRYVYGKTRDIVHEKWQARQRQARAVKLATITVTVDEYLAGWLAQVARPRLEPATCVFYETMIRRHISPWLGTMRVDRLQASDVQAWLGKLAARCQCCAQRKDAGRPPADRRCCAIGRCCHDNTGPRTVEAARNTLRTALGHAVARNQLPVNVAALAQPPRRPRRSSKRPTWTAGQASRFLASARADADALYAAYVLIIVNDLTGGQALGLTWSSIGESEIDAAWRLQRAGSQLIHARHGSVIVPLAGLSRAALTRHRNQQQAARERAGDRWQPSDLVFTTRRGTPVEPRNFTRSFDARCAKAGVPRIRVRDARSALTPPPAPETEERS